jgi:hypothetical protein
VSGGRSTPREQDTEKTAIGAQRGSERTSQGKRIQFDLETWHALNMLARDRMMTFQELADEAFRDLLRKHGRPTDLKDALKRSLTDTEPQRPQQRGKGRTRLREH